MMEDSPAARHEIVDYLGCRESAALGQAEILRATLLEAAGRIGATVVGESFHQFSPQGVTGVVMLAESHLAVHTWPERSYAAVDLFTCGNLDPQPGLDYLAECLGSTEMRRRTLRRGPD